MYIIKSQKTEMINNYLEFSKFQDLFAKLSYFALSLDGYKYKDENKEFSIITNINNLSRGETIKEEEFLPTLFFLQRFIARGDQGVTEKEIKIFLKLFLVCLNSNLITSEKFKNYEYFDKWENLKQDIKDIKKQAEQQLKILVDGIT